METISKRHNHLVVRVNHMDIINILIPKELYAVIVFVLQLIFFALWCMLLLKSSISLSQVYKKISELDDISELSEIIREKFLPNSTPENQSSPLISESTALRRFDAFCDKISLDKFKSVAKHLKAIFLAGFKEGVLDVNSLIKTTNNELISGSAGFRAVLSLFIILGLLGTLTGLAFSLSDFSNILPTGENLTQQSLSKALTSLLPKLGGSFATSIIGVAFTIIGVIFFTIYQYLWVYPLARKLEQETLTNWIPNLVTTPAQRLLEKLQLSEQQMQKNFEAAQQVARFADQIKDDASELSESIKNAKSPLKILRDASQNLAGFSQNFIQSTERLTFFQGDLQNLYKNMSESSEVFEQTVRKIADDNVTFQQTVEDKFGDQSAQIGKLLGAYLAQTDDLASSLKFFESEYLQDRQKLDAKLGDALDSARQAYSELGKQNQAVVEGLGVTVGAPLKSELSSGLKTISESLESSVVSEIANTSRKLNEVVSSLNSMNNPLTRAADKIEGTAQNFDERTTKLLTSLQNQFLQQNQVSVQQVQNLESLNNGVNNLSGRFQEMSQLSKHLGILNTTITELKVTIDKLNAGARSSENSIQPADDKGFWQRLRGN